MNNVNLTLDAASSGLVGMAFVGIVAVLFPLISLVFYKTVLRDARAETQNGFLVGFFIMEFLLIIGMLSQTPGCTLR